MSAESKKVLEMLAERKITSEEAEKLLDKLSATQTDSAASASAAKPGEAAAAEPKKQRFLRIVVERPGEQPINLRMPLPLTRAGKLLGILPLKVGQKLADYGIDLSAFATMNEADMDQCLETLNMQIDKGDGKKVQIFCE